MDCCDVHTNRFYLTTLIRVGHGSNVGVLANNVGVLNYYKCGGKLGVSLSSNISKEVLHGLNSWFRFEPLPATI
jgi:hypothetical protein